jgi:pyruvate/2-oxoglutarate dehydrogenase complex dihydrolipoamide dehydrogenase (E3) component
VNVGCIPKKLMHQAAIHHENIESAFDYGWDLDKINDYNSENNTLKQKFNWKTMVTNI